MRAVVRQPIVILWLSLLVVDLMVLLLVCLALGWELGERDET